MNIKQVLTSSLAVIAMSFGVSTARADHDFNILEAKADALYTVMLDLDRTFVTSYVRSRVFGEIMATSGQIKAKSIHLRVMAKHGTPCDWAYEVKALDDLVCRMTRLVGDAHYRARHHLDPPIGRCAINVREQLKAMNAIVQCMKDALDIGPVVAVPRYNAPVNPPIDQTRYYRGNDRYAAYRDVNRTYGNQYDRYGFDRSGYRSAGRNVQYDHHGITFGNGQFSFRINF